MGPEFAVVAAYPTTVRTIRSMMPGDPQPPLWPESSAGESAALCYLDGPVAKAPPAENAAPFDRAVVAVKNGEQVLVVAGYRDKLPVTAPRE